MDPQPVIVEKIFSAPIERVWRAITNKDEMAQWYFKLDEFRPEVGFEFQFEGGDDKNTYLHHCKVTEVVPGRKLKYSWRYEGHEGNSFVTWELSEHGKNETRLKLTHEGLETFPALPAFARKNFAQGWNEIVGTNLPNYVSKVIKS